MLDGYVVLLDDKPAQVEMTGGEGAQSAFNASVSAAAALAAELASEAAAGLAIGAAEDSADSADAAALSAAAADQSATDSEGSSLDAEGFAADAGNYLAGVTALADDFDFTDLLPLQATSRTIMRAFTGMVVGRQVMLSEAGREGLFVFSSADFSALVSLDPEEGLYVAPSTDATGASGAWVRKFDGPAHLKWFGVSGTATPSANFAATTAALALLESLGVTGYGYESASMGLRLPDDACHFDDTIQVNHAIEIFGSYAGVYGGGGSVLEWDADVPGFQVNAAGCYFHNFLVKGDYSGTESESHAFDLRAKATIHDVFGEYWSGDGINGDSIAHIANVNVCDIRGCVFRFCRIAYSFHGGDANGLSIFSCKGSLNRQYGVLIKDTIGESVVSACEFSSNGTGSPVKSMSSYLGNRFAVLPGQEVWCSTNAPPATATRNQGWYYLGAGGADTDHVAWTTGLTWRSGGVGYLQGGSNYNTVVGGYAELDQLPLVAEGHCVSINFILIRPDGSPYGGTIFGNGDALSLLRCLSVGEAGVRGRVSLMENTNEYFRTLNLENTAGWYLRTAGAIMAFTDAFSGQDVFYVSGATGLSYGRDAAVSGVFNPKKIAVGVDSNARIWDAGTAAPTTGSHAAGEIVYNIAPSAGGKLGWVCTAAGTPGTWKPFGAIDA